MLPFWSIAAAVLAQRAGFKWARLKWVMVFFCLTGVVGIALGIKEIASLELYPACLQGTLRYVTFVSETQACRPDMIELGHAPKGPPPVPILSTILFLGIGLAMWISRGWPWLCLGSLIMFVMASMPQSIAGSLSSNMAEPIISAAALLTARHFVDQKSAHQG